MTDAARPSPIEPDTKDWTWVLERPCAECGFDVRGLDRDQIGGLLRETVAQWLTVLAGDRSTIGRRPDPATWSPLEYGCHVRDVCALYLERLELMLTEDGPHYANWDQDQTAIDSGYHRADPAEVATALETAGSALADRFDGVSGAAWAQTGFRSDGAAFTVESFARYFIHDPVHHLHDVHHPHDVGE